MSTLRSRLWEKPSEYGSLSALAKSKARRLCPGYSAIGLPVVRRAKQLVESGEFGKLITVHVDFNWSASGNNIPYGRSDHWALPAAGRYSPGTWPTIPLACWWMG